MRRRRRIWLAVLVAPAALGGGLAWRIHTWGRPVPAAYEREAVTPGDAGGGRSVAYRRVYQSGEPRPAFIGRTVTIDADGDGTVDLVLGEGSAPASFARPRPGDADARWLVLCLDGVPYEEMLALWEEGYFREFFRPVPLISPFPSDSESALTDLFHTGPVPGYEHRYFDRPANRLAGGALTTLTGKDIPYLEQLDYDMPGYLKGLAYVLPEKSYRADLGRLRRRFLASREKIYLAHLASSDSLYHILPPEEMRRRLREVDSLVRELYLDAGGKLRITLFSDHGNSLVASRGVRLEEFLAGRGWRLAERLEGPRDVVVPAYGLVGFLAVYCQPGARAELARELAQLDGADLVVSAEADGALIEARRGRARLAWNAEARAFRYEPLSGDPLGLLDIFARLQVEDKIDTEGWVKDADLFAATTEHLYPDPGYRLWQWATNHVRNRADLLVSLRPGHFYGRGAFQHLVDIQSTHGALDRAQSLGFTLSTDGPQPGPLRSRDLLPKNLADEKGGRQKLENRK